MRRRCLVLCSYKFYSQFLEIQIHLRTCVYLCVYLYRNSIFFFSPKFRQREGCFLSWLLGLYYITCILDYGYFLEKNRRRRALERCNRPRLLKIWRMLMMILVMKESLVLSYRFILFLRFVKCNTWLLSVYSHKFQRSISQAGRNIACSEGLIKH